MIKEMTIDVSKSNGLIALLNSKQLLSCAETTQAKAVFEDGFPFENQVAIASSVHFHIHVANIDNLPHNLFKTNGGSVVNKADGYIKYAFDGGINFIFSHIPVAQKEKAERLEDEVYLDHIGIDIRSDDKESYITFQSIPLVCAVNNYLFTRQGDGKDVVKCCHMQVNEKYWVYPNGRLNYEFAFGPLVIHEGGFGVDLRPANPFVKTDGVAEACCGAEKPKSAIFIN